MDIYLGARSHDQDIHVRQCGSEVCTSGHAFGPAVRDYHLIHSIASGRGTFYAEGREYPLGANQGFIIFPGQVTTYRADEKDPWVYGWMGYEGRDATILTETVGLTRENPVFHMASGAETVDRIRRVTRTPSDVRLFDLALVSELYAMLFEIGKARPTPREDALWQYYRRAAWYLKGNYQRDVRIEDVSRLRGPQPVATLQGIPESGRQVAQGIPEYAQGGGGRAASQDDAAFDGGGGGLLGLRVRSATGQDVPRVNRHYARRVPEGFQGLNRMTACCPPPFLQMISTLHRSVFLQYLSALISK